MPNTHRTPANAPLPLSPEEWLNRVVNQGKPAHTAHHQITIGLQLKGIPALPRQDAYALTDFLRYQDADFIWHTYHGVLHRSPDAAGNAYYLHALRTGALSQLEVIGRLRFSPEGKKIGVRIHGLSPAFWIKSTRHLPLIGRVFDWLLCLASLPSMMRNLQTLTHAQARDKRELVQDINEQLQHIDTRLKS